jgi:hypothetical protein
MPQGGLQIFGAGLQLQQTSPGVVNVGNFNLGGVGIARSFDTRTAATAGGENSYFGSLRTFGVADSQGSAGFGGSQKLGNPAGFTPQFATLMGSSASVFCDKGTALGNAANAGVDRGNVAQSNPHTTVGYAATATGDAADFTTFANTCMGSQSAAIGRRVYAFGYLVQVSSTGQTDVIAIGSNIGVSAAGLTNTLVIRSGAATKTLIPAVDNNSILIGEATQPRVIIGPYTIGQSAGTTALVNDANKVASATEGKILYTAISAARAVTLPAANAVPSGYVVSVADMSGSVTAVNTVTIGPAGADTIVGPAGVTAILNAAYASRKLMSDGTSKWLIAANW